MAEGACRGQRPSYVPLVAIAVDSSNIMQGSDGSLITAVPFGGKSSKVVFITIRVLLTRTQYITASPKKVRPSMVAVKAFALFSVEALIWIHSGRIPTVTLLPIGAWLPCIVLSSPISVLTSSGARRTPGTQLVRPRNSATVRFLGAQ